MADAEKRWGAPYLVIHRADLQQALADAVAERANVDLRLGFEVAGVAETADGVALGLKRGALSLRESGDVVDRRRRAALARTRAARPRRARRALFSGRVAFRATVPGDLRCRRAGARPRSRCGSARARISCIIPCAAASVVNLVAVDRIGLARRKERSIPGTARPTALRWMRAFADWSRETRDADRGARTSGAPGRSYHREPIARFAAWPRRADRRRRASDGSRFSRRAPAQAIEDAGALARRLGERRDVAAALAAYSRERAPRAARVQREALAQARIYHMRGPFALARDLTMRALGPERLLARYDWLYAA